MITDPQYLVQRSLAYDARTEQQPTALAHPSVTVLPPAWEPPPRDITEADALFAFLSPQVRRFAIVMQALLSQTEGLERDAADRPCARYRSMMQNAGHLLAVVGHRSVTDNAGHVLPADHPDRNPRRVANVLMEAARTACRALLVADACGALEEEG